MEQLFKRMRDLREDHDCTQKQVAETLGIYQQTYSSYEMGIRQLPLRYLPVLAEFYDCSTDYLLGLTAYQYSLDRLMKPFCGSMTTDALLSGLLLLNTEKRKLLLAYLDYLKKT
ncbi:helix-turn-helix domain-containing protein [Candidatus Soleaferrea massiliensis]|uniref:helix-turn-helix domain-containing protein n=1 Tax=Candidatus Soleaferrea massiliensis TaxID=1470354 RepID=UPI00058C5BEE|nr:helix-turn-helix transcriptional regulator [Candidatus Soleaferrea massiliensis]